MSCEKIAFNDEYKITLEYIRCMHAYMYVYVWVCCARVWVLECAVVLSSISVKTNGKSYALCWKNTVKNGTHYYITNEFLNVCVRWAYERSMYNISYIMNVNMFLFAHLLLFCIDNFICRCSTNAHSITRTCYVYGEYKLLYINT